MKRVKQTKTVKAFQLPIEITREGDHFIAHCPRWKDCYAQGKSIDEATSEIIAVASSLIELYEEEDLRIPLQQKNQPPLVKMQKYPLLFQYSLPHNSCVHCFTET